jgi:hypothetical protein
MVPRSTEIPNKLPELENYATTVPENTEFPTGLSENFSIPGMFIVKKDCKKPSGVSKEHRGALVASNVKLGNHCIFLT